MTGPRQASMKRRASSNRRTRTPDPNVGAPATPSSEGRSIRARPLTRGLVCGAVALGLLGCGDAGSAGEEVEVVVPSGASFAEVADSMEARGLIGSPLLFRVLARVRGDDRAVRAGTYRFSSEAGHRELLDDLRAGRVVHVSMTIPEGFTIPRIADRLAHALDVDPDSARAFLEDPQRAERYEVPGPTLEGYLFPETYHFDPGISLGRGVEALVGRYREVWAERAERAEALDLSEREVVTLASIVEAEARRADEKPRIAGVFLNRLEIGYPLQADPTVMYALGEHRDRLLYAAIDSVAGHPYNTYTERGLPPGPIGSPGAAALDAVLEPEEHDYLYFVAHPDGTHEFNRTLEEHNRARARLRSEWQDVWDATGGDPEER